MNERKEVILHVLLNLIRGLYKAVDDSWRKSAANNGLTVSQQHLLWILYFENGSTLSEISKYGLWHLSTVMDLVNRMEKHQLVHKKVDISDARTKRVFLTEKGFDLLKASYESTALYEFLDVLYNENNKHMLPQYVKTLYNLNRAFNGEEFVSYVHRTASKFPKKE